MRSPRQLLHLFVLPALQKVVAKSIFKALINNAAFLRHVQIYSPGKALQAKAEICVLLALQE